QDAAGHGGQAGGPPGREAGAAGTHAGAAGEEAVSLRGRGEPRRCLKPTIQGPTMTSPHLPLFALFGLALAAGPAAAQPNDALNDANEQALKAAVLKVAPCVVQIETSGGTEQIVSGPRTVRKGTGPTTGVVVSPDGYVISSAFNFANKPSAVF